MLILERFRLLRTYQLVFVQRCCQIDSLLVCYLVVHIQMQEPPNSVVYQQTVDLCQSGQRLDCTGSAVSHRKDPTAVEQLLVDARTVCRNHSQLGVGD